MFLECPEKASLQRRQKKKKSVLVWARGYKQGFTANRQSGSLRGDKNVLKLTAQFYVNIIKSLNFTFMTDKFCHIIHTSINLFLKSK